MRLVIVGYDSLDNLEKLVTEMFSGVCDGSGVPDGSSIIAPEVSAAGAPWRIGNEVIAKQLESLGIWNKLLKPDLNASSRGHKKPQETELKPGSQGASLGCLFRISPIKEGNTLNITWQLPPQLDNAGLFVCEYLTHLIGHESAGSILAQLKDKGWATQLDCNCSPRVGGYENNTACTLLVVQIQLTSSGLHDWRFVAGLVYEYIGVLEREGPQKWVFDEMKRLHAIAFPYKEEEDYGEYAVDLSVKMLPHSGILPSSLIDTVTSMRWAPNEIERALNHLRPELARVDMRSHIFLPLNSKKRGAAKKVNNSAYHSLLTLGSSSRKTTETYMNNQYHVERIPAGTIKLWNDLRSGDMTVVSMENGAFRVPSGARNSSKKRLIDEATASSQPPAGSFDGLHLPQHNPFIPDNLGVLGSDKESEDVARDKKFPLLLGRSVSLETRPVVGSTSPILTPAFLTQIFTGTGYSSWQKAGCRILLFFFKSLAMVDALERRERGGRERESERERGEEERERVQAWGAMCRPDGRSQQHIVRVVFLAPVRMPSA